MLKMKSTPLNAQLNPSCHLLALLGAHHILHVSRVRVKTLQYLLQGTGWKYIGKAIPDVYWTVHHCDS